MKNYLLRHAQVFFYVVGQLARTPLTSLMTTTVIGITLSLPSVLYVLIENVQSASRGWEGNASISLFLKNNVSLSAAENLSTRIRRIPGVAAVEHISREEALAEFKQLSGFGEALDALGKNPLPSVLVVHPMANGSDPVSLEKLLARLKQNNEVDLAQLDLEWVKRLHALLQIARRGVWVLAALLGLAVLLIIGNTIRLAILNRREEIVIIKLIGGTNAFIRRPFLYAGLLQGLLGGLTAWLLVSMSLWLIAGPVRDLANLYASSYWIQGLDLTATLGLLVLGGALGWLGSRLSVGHHLRQIEPS